jgi:hypothetical protein
MGLESLDEVSNLLIPLFALYLLIFCNFTKETLGCRLTNVLDNNMYAKHFITFLLLYFLVIVTDSNNLENGVFISLGWTVVVYIIFMITTRVSFPIMIVLLILMMASYILGNTAKKRLDEKKEDEYKKLKSAQNIMFILLITFTTTGFMIYMIEKYREYKGTFSIVKFLFGNSKCRQYTPADVRIL